MSKPRYIYIFKDFLKIQLHAVNYMSRVEFMFWGVIVWIWAPRANAPRLTFIDIMAGDASRVSHCILSHPVSVESISCHLSATLHFPQILITTNCSIGLNVTIRKCAITFPHYWSHKLIFLLQGACVVLLLTVDDITIHLAPSSSPSPVTWDSYPHL